MTLEASGATGIDGDQADNSVRTAGAVYVYTRTGTSWSQQAYIKASNTGMDDEFGASVALSSDGSTLAVGAYGEDSNATGIDGDQIDKSASFAGAVYVYTRAGGMWSQQAYVKASNTEAGDKFGGVVALSSDGSRLAVVAPGEASRATGIDGDQTDNSASSAGAIYVYARTGATWSQEAYVKASNTEAMDGFGGGVRLSGDGSIMASGKCYEASRATGIDGDQTDNSASNAGAVYIYRRVGATWSQQAYIKASNTDAGDGFCSVALSSDGSTLAVGATGEASSASGVNGDQTNNDVESAGAVYKFARTGNEWSQQAYLKASNTAASAIFTGGLAFGFSVALSADGSTLAAGAIGDPSAATGIGGSENDHNASSAGAVHVFQR